MSIFAKIRHTGLPFIIIILAVVIMAVLIALKPKAPKQVIAEKPFLVKTETVSSRAVTFNIASQGNVQPVRKTILSAQVAGQIEWLAENFVNGQAFKKGEVLLKLEQADRLSELQLAQAELARAQASYAEELARGKVAQAEWQAVTETEITDLALRKPQLAREKANLQAAKANLARAQRNLARTQIKAPYDGLILTQQVEVGQFVGIGTPLAEIADVQVAEVRLPLTEQELAYLDNSKPGKVSLHAFANGQQQQWSATIIGEDGVVNTQNRVVYVLAHINNPYQNKEKTLRFGTFVTADIQGQTYTDLILLPRNLLRLDGTVFVMLADDTLDIRAVKSIRMDDDFAYIQTGLNDGDRIITSPIPNAYQGMQLRVLEDAQ